jgi:hypothetical protein
MDGNFIGSFLVLGVVGALIVQFMWRRTRAEEAKQWPTSEAIIESGAVEVVARTRYGKVELPVFAFSYRVGVGYYSGHFALLPYVTDPANL